MEAKLLFICKSVFVMLVIIFFVSLISIKFLPSYFPGNVVIVLLVLAGWSLLIVHYLQR